MDDKVAVANNTNVIKVYALKSGSCEFLRGHKDIVLSLSTHKEWLVSGAKVSLYFHPSWLHFISVKFNLNFALRITK